MSSQSALERERVGRPDRIGNPRNVGNVTELIRRMPWHREEAPEHYEQLLTREWLVTNGLGGYASGTVAGVTTRRYHGLLIAALPAPHGRTMMLTHLTEQLRLPDGTLVRVGGREEATGKLEMYGADDLIDFRLEAGLPAWRYRIGDTVIEKHIVLPHEQNTVHVIYRLLEGKGPLRLKIMPSMSFRSHDAHVNTPLPEPFRLVEEDCCFEITSELDLPPLRMTMEGERMAFTVERRTMSEWLYRLEESRGYEFKGKLWSPGYFRIDLHRDREATLTASTEDWETIRAVPAAETLKMELQRRQRLLGLADPRARGGFAAELVLAADQFLIKPAGRSKEEMRARASGDEARTVIAGYHWFTDWGRDTMISLEGLTLTTGRHAEAGYLLRTFSQYIRDGLIPNLFPEGESEGLYHTADATLWFFHAIDRYVDATGDRETLRMLIPRLLDIVDHHLRGTRFGIGVDSADGLLRQGEEDYQLTWMDAKVEGWVVTPRRGKAVEINALWYNALRLLERWLREEGREGQADEIASHADRGRASFNRRFWYEEGKHLYDIIDGEQGADPACRPNQVFAISLPHPILDPARWTAVMQSVEERLLTPMGLRSLAPGHPDYKPIYYGDLRARDAAYHQGTVWGWLIGPFVDAWLKVYPHDVDGARALLESFQDHFSEACIGSISEIFDAEAPYRPRGCVAQAWSVAEVLRCWVKTHSAE